VFLIGAGARPDLRVGAVLVEQVDVNKVGEFPGDVGLQHGGIDFRRRVGEHGALGIVAAADTQAPGQPQHHPDIAFVNAADQTVGDQDTQAVHHAAGFGLDPGAFLAHPFDQLGRPAQRPPDGLPSASRRSGDLVHPPAVGEHDRDLFPIDAGGGVRNEILDIVGLVERFGGLVGHHGGSS
jgi:hypothetical protein